MTSVACFNFQERVFPYLRGLVARRLLDAGLRQGRVAVHLGVSQAMVSKYVRALPPLPPGGSEVTWRRLADEAAARVLEDERRGGLAPWCALCTGMGEPATQAFAAIESCLRG